MFSSRKSWQPVRKEKKTNSVNMLAMLSVIFAGLASWLASAETTTIKNLPTVIAEEIAPYNSTEIWSNDFDDPQGSGAVRAFTVTNASLGFQDEVESGSSDNATIVEKSVITICCDPGLYYTGFGKCGKNESNPPEELIFPTIYDSSLRNSSKKPEDFLLRYRYPCIDGSYGLYADGPNKDVFYLLENGTIFQPHNRDYPTIESDKYCLASMMADNGTKHLVLACFPILPPPEQEKNIRFILYPVAMCLSTLFLVATIVVYSIVPELKTMHGFTLRCYLACLTLSYVGLSIAQLIGATSFIANKPDLCKSLAFIIYFSFLSSFFWLNVMCFDIWWTFGGFRSMQGTVRQREKKKFIIYSIYAWGCASLLTGTCIIMDYVPNIPKSYIRPEFGTGSCWFTSDSAKALYFYGPIGVTVFCNIILFISTTVKIIRHKRDTAHHLQGMDSRRHDDNKQWFNLYIKLFIVMGINWSMEIISWLFKESPQYVWYITDLANTLQGVIIFIIFVWKDKTKRLLMKRLGCENGSFQSRNSTRSAYHSSASRTCTTTTAVMAPLQDKSNPYTERTKTTTDDSDCV